MPWRCTNCVVDVARGAPCWKCGKAEHDPSADVALETDEIEELYVFVVGPGTWLLNLDPIGRPDPADAPFGVRIVGPFWTFAGPLPRLPELSLATPTVRTWIRGPRHAHTPAAESALPP